MNKKLKFLVSQIVVCSLACTSVLAGAAHSNALADEISVNDEDNVVESSLEATDTPEVVNEGKIKLSDDGTTFTGEGIEVDGNIVTIKAAGSYTISGSLIEGQIIIDAGDEDEVELKLNGVDIKNSTGAAIYAKNADETIINLKSDTVNNIEDGKEYSEDSINDDQNGAVFSKDDLRIKGSGTLNVTGNYKNGIVSKDDLKIKNGIINVTSVSNGLKGKDSVQYEDATLTVNAGGDGIKSDNDEDTEKGYIEITSGTLNITSSEDGIQAENYVDISGGNYSIVSGGGSKNAEAHQGDMGGMQGGFNPGMMDNEEGQEEDTSEDDSCKGIKAGNKISISSGEFSIDSKDDTIHCNDTVDISGGSIKLLSGDDGIHGDTTLLVDKATVDIQKCYEGLEAGNITINGGNINIIASDDGINAAEKTTTINDETAGGEVNNNDTRGGFGKMTIGNALLKINGGTVYVNASGDGLDSNGSIEMTGGTVLVDGPTNNGNGALDYDRTFNISGGTLVAAGSSGMAQSPSTISTQNSIKVTTENKTANTLINVKDSEGNDIITYSPSKQYASVVISTPGLKTDGSYKVNYGGTCDGSASNGLYSDGVYSGGTLFKEFTISSIITSINSSGVTEGNDDGMMGGDGFPGGNGRPDYGTGTPDSGDRPQRPGFGTDTPDGNRPERPGFGTGTPGSDFNPGRPEDATGTPGGEQNPGDPGFGGNGQEQEGSGFGGNEQGQEGQNKPATSTVSDENDASGNTSDNSKVAFIVLSLLSAIGLKMKFLKSRVVKIKK